MADHIEFHAMQNGGDPSSSDRGAAPFHFITARALNRRDMEELASGADAFRERARTEQGMRELNGLLSHKRAILYFNQPSSRTFFSFMNACHILGVKVSEVRDTSVTSLKKGESFEDTICLLYTSPSPRDLSTSRMPSSA